jgi:hypothetical protein
MKTIYIALVAALVGGCALPEHERTNFDTPDGGDLGDAAPAVPVDSCTESPHYTACWFGREIGVCLFGECRRACEEDAICNDGDPCTETECFWGYCRSDNYCG